MTFAVHARPQTSHGRSDGWAIRVEDWTEIRHLHASQGTQGYGDREASGYCAGNRHLGCLPRIGHPETYWLPTVTVRRLPARHALDAREVPDCPRLRVGRTCGLGRVEILVPQRVALLRVEFTLRDPADRIESGPHVVRRLTGARGNLSPDRLPGRSCKDTAANPRRSVKDAQLGQVSGPGAVRPAAVHAAPTDARGGRHRIEIIAGVVVAIHPRLGAQVVAAWLVGIIVNLLLIPGFYDVALRDFGLFLAAVALARLATRYDTRPLIWLSRGN